MAALIAAVIHDAAHPGTSNVELNNSGHVLSAVYHNRSAAENFSVALGMKLLDHPKTDFLGESASAVSPAERTAIVKRVQELVMVTDISADDITMRRARAMIESRRRRRRAEGGGVGGAERVVAVVVQTGGGRQQRRGEAGGKCCGRRR